MLQSEIFIKWDFVLKMRLSSATAGEAMNPESSSLVATILNASFASIMVVLPSSLKK